MTLLLGTILYLTFTSSIPPFISSVSTGTFPNGNYVVTWQYSDGSINSNLYNNNGTQQVNSTIIAFGHTTLPPSVGTWANGSFVVVWGSQTSNITNTYDLYAQLFFSNGSLNGNKTLINQNEEGIVNPQPQGPLVATSQDSYVVGWCANQEECSYAYQRTSMTYQYGGPPTNYASAALCQWEDGSFVFLNYFNNSAIYAVAYNTETGNHESAKLQYQPKSGQLNAEVTTEVLCMPDGTVTVVFAYPFSVFTQQFYVNGTAAGNVETVSAGTNDMIYGFDSQIISDGYIVAMSNSEGIYASIFNNENVEIAYNVEISNNTEQSNNIFGSLSLSASSNSSQIMVASIYNTTVQMNYLVQTSCATKSCPGNYLCNKENSQCVQCLTNKECGTPPFSFCHANMCNLCQSNSDCKNNESAPVCGKNGLCGQCASNTDCTGQNEGVCNLETNTCVMCTENSECSNDSTSPVCVGNLCSACQNSEQCFGMGSNNYCSAGGLCVECLFSAQCEGALVCSGNSACVTCMNNTECAGNSTGNICNSNTGECIGCNSNSECQSENPNFPICVNSVCQGCKTQQECGSEFCNIETGLCVQCVQNSECGSNEACSNSVCISSSSGGGFPWTIILISLGVIGVVALVYFGRKWVSNSSLSSDGEDEEKKKETQLRLNNNEFL